MNVFAQEALFLLSYLHWFEIVLLLRHRSTQQLVTYDVINTKKNANTDGKVVVKWINIWKRNRQVMEDILSDISSYCKYQLRKGNGCCSATSLMWSKRAVYMWGAVFNINMPDCCAWQYLPFILYKSLNVTSLLWDFECHNGARYYRYIKTG